MMETVETNICRTCLGPLVEAPKNLLEGQFADVLELLRGFVATLVDFQTEDVLNVCSFCYEKLDYICKFRDQCQKSFQDYMEIKNKKDPVISNLGQIFEDDYLSAKIDLESENLEETITIYKNSEETNCSDPAVEPAVAEPQTPTSTNPKRGSKAKQFPTEDVVAAVDECNLYQTAYDKRKCIHCEFITKTNRQLCSHMKCKHVDELRAWCSRCNTQTSDLEEHTKAVQCSEYVCKFCNKKCMRLFVLMAHLKSHASEHFTNLAKKSKSITQQASTTPQAANITLNIPQQHNPENSLQQLSNVVFDQINTNAVAIAINTAQVSSVQVDNSSSQQFALTPLITSAINNNESTTSLLNATPIAPQQVITTDGKIKVSRVSKQYDSALVLQALAECANFTKDVKNRTCRNCHVVTSIASGLKSHMARAHADLFPLWCNRCNIQTEDLQAHRDLIKCHMFQCKFCEKAFDKLNKLTKHIQCHCHEIFRNKAANVEEEPTVQLQALTSVSNDHQQSGDSLPILENTDGNITYENSQQEFQFFTAVSTDVNMSYQPQNSQSQESLEAIPEATEVKMEGSFAENTDGTGMTFESSENTDGNITYESLANMNAKMAYESFAADADDVQIKYEEPEMKSEESQMLLTDMTESSSMDEIKEELKAEDSFLSFGTNSNDSYPYPNSCDTDEDMNPDPNADHSTDGSGPTVLDQVDPKDVIRALASVRKPTQTHHICGICRSVMTDNRELGLHMTVVHKEEKEKWCRTCNDLFDDIDKHKIIHAPKCEFCNKILSSLSQLRGHLKNHARIHMFNTSTLLTCKTCLNNFPDEELLSTHECATIPSKVDHDSAYQLNLQAFKHTEELLHKCSHCDKSFAAKHLLTIHEKQHTEEKKNICHICSRPFPTSGQLENHMMTHTAKPLKCTQCGKSFTFKAQLTGHMRQHSGEKPHMCSFADCGRTFSNKSALSSHFRHTHSDNRPFKCTYCDLSFKVKGTMKNHEFTHTGEKPYKCTQCEYSCRQSHRLTHHMKQHRDPPHQEEQKVNHTCVFCQESFTTHLLLMSHTYAIHGEMHMEGINSLDTNATQVVSAINPQTTTANAPNVVNITSHHIIIQDGNSSQTIQISGLDMNQQAMDTSRISDGASLPQLTQLVSMDTTGGSNMPALTMDSNTDGNMDTNMDDIDQVPIQIVYKPLGLG